MGPFKHRSCDRDIESSLSRISSHSSPQNRMVREADLIDHDPQQARPIHPSSDGSDLAAFPTSDRKQTKSAVSLSMLAAFGETNTTIVDALLASRIMFRAVWRPRIPGPHPILLLQKLRTDPGPSAGQRGLPQAALCCPLSRTSAPIRSQPTITSSSATTPNISKSRQRRHTGRNQPPHRRSHHHSQPEDLE
jgi:hypothetical protein